MVRHAGVLASASKVRSRIVPVEAAPAEDPEECKPPKRDCRYRTWTELLATLGIDALACTKCEGRMWVLALMREGDLRRRTLIALGEATEAPPRAPARGPPYWSSRALRIRRGAADAASRRPRRETFTGP